MPPLSLRPRPALKPARWRGVLTCWVLAWPGLVRAAEPNLNARALGIAESVAGFCSSVDPESTSQWQAKIKTLTQGASAQALVAVRDGDEYRMANDSMLGFVAKIDAHNTKRFCSGAAASNR